MAKQNAGILKQNPSAVSTTKSSRSGLNKSHSKSRGMNRNKSHSKKFLHSNLSDFNQTAYSNTKRSFRDPNRRKDCCSSDREKLKDVQASLPFQNLGGPPAVKQYKKSKSSSKLSSVPAATRIYRKSKDNSQIYMSQRKVNQSKSPQRSSRAQSRGRGNNETRQTSHSEDGRSDLRTFEGRERSARKEQAPIIINKDE
jgi:hypothetical protein